MLRTFISDRFLKSSAEKAKRKSFQDNIVGPTNTQLRRNPARRAAKVLFGRAKLFSEPRVKCEGFV